MNGQLLPMQLHLIIAVSYLKKILSGWSVHFPTDGFLRRIWNVSIMVYFLPNHCYLLDFWSQKNVQLYWVDGWISNPQILANLLGFCGSSLYGLFIFVLFHQIHPHYIRKGLRISTVGWNAWFHDQFVIDGKSFSFFLHPFLNT